LPDPRGDRSMVRIRSMVIRAAGSRRRSWPLWMVPAAAMLALVAGGGTYRAFRAPSLSYTVGGNPGGLGSLVQADAETDLRFSDGTEIDLERASSGQVAATGPHGARVQLHRGRARVHVVPRRGNDWVFQAGPCQLQVTGTKFDMHWSERDQVLEVLLYNGSVVVKGPPAPDGVVMHQAQRLVMDVARGQARLGPLAQQGAETEPPRRQPAVRTAPSESPAPSEMPASDVDDEPPVRSERRAEGWSARVLAGDFDRVLREAKRRGFSQVLARDGAPEVMALAEAARYSHRLPLARRALAAVRDRFPGSPQAQKAAFLLGRMAEDQDGDLVAALSWYGEYLAATPEGPYRDEALGRQMAATQRLSGSGKARSLAEQYLRRYPDGPYAAPARAVLQSRP
jgi:transmembrane sensor